MVVSPQRPRRGAGIASLLGVVTSVVLASGTTPARAATAVVVIEGRGFGHGVGMAQDGAYWMGRSGRSAGEIIKLFYPGTALSKRGGTVRVPLLAAREATFGFPSGGSVAGLEVPAGGSVRVTANGGTLTATAVSRTTPAPGPAADPDDSGPVLALPVRPVRIRLLADVTADVTADPTTSVSTGTVPGIAAGTTVATTVEASLIPPVATGPPATPVVADAPPVPSSAPVTEQTTTAPDQATSSTVPVPVPPSASGGELTARPAAGGVLSVGARRYRGALVMTGVGDSLRVVNAVDVEQYLRGMGEVLDPRWPAAALQAQTIAARTYALRTMELSGEVCPTERCQVYLGAQAEYPAMDSAVRATAGRVVTYQDAMALTFYSASGGGTIADPTEVFGPTSRTVPYLQAGVYPTGDLRSWTVELTLEQLGRRFGYGGTAQAVTVSQVGPSGRAVEVTIDGTAGARRIAGPAFDAALGLRSTNFTLRMGTSATTPSEPGGVGDAGDPDGATGAGAIIDAQSQLLGLGQPSIALGTQSATAAEPAASSATGAGATGTTAAPTIASDVPALTSPAGLARAASHGVRGSGPDRGWIGLGAAALVALAALTWVLRWALLHGDGHDGGDHRDL